MYTVSVYDDGNYRNMLIVRPTKTKALKDLEAAIEQFAIGEMHWVMYDDTGSMCDSSPRGNGNCLSFDNKHFELVSISYCTMWTMD